MLQFTVSLDADLETIALLDEGKGKVRPADAPTKTLVKNPAGKPLGVLFLSNEVNPSLVKRSVQRAAEAKSILGPDVGSVILEPLAEGVFEGFSYALWPWRRPLSSSRLFFYMQKRMLQSAVLSWLREVAARTRHPAAAEEIRAHYALPLQNVAGDARFSNMARDEAEAGLRRLQAGEWQPARVLQHGDLHLRNLLLWQKKSERPRDSRPFIVVDWSGAHINGHPFSDLVTFGSSVRLPQRLLGAEVRCHCQVLGCRPVDAMSYLLSALGSLGMRAEHFPEDLYRVMCNRAVDVLARALQAIGV